MGEVVQGPSPSRDGEAPVTKVNVVELEVPDRFRAGGVNGGESEDEPSARSGRGIHGLFDLVVLKRQEDLAWLFTDPDSGGGVFEDCAVAFAVPKQRPQRCQRVMALAAGEAVDELTQVCGSDLAEVVVAF